MMRKLVLLRVGIDAGCGRIQGLLFNVYGPIGAKKIVHGVA